MSGKNCFNLQQMQDVADYPYHVMQMDSRMGTDMLYTNGHLIHHVRQEMGDKSYGVSNFL